MNKKILVIGDSHTHAFKRIISSSRNIKDIEVLTFAKIKNGVKIGDIFPEKMQSKIKKNIKNYKAIVSFTGGNQHNSLSLIKHNEDISIPNQFFSEYIGTNGQKIPREAFQIIFRKSLEARDFNKLINSTKELNLPIYHVAATPPKESTLHILKRPESDFVRRNIAEFGVTDAEIRLEIYKIQMEVTRKLCEELGISFLDLPSKVLDKNGFLAPMYYANDATHANTKFAEALITHLQKIIN